MCELREQSELSPHDAAESLCAKGKVVCYARSFPETPSGGMVCQIKVREKRDKRDKPPGVTLVGDGFPNKVR